jgi:hypothetical protein
MLPVLTIQKADIYTGLKKNRNFEREINEDTNTSPTSTFLRTQVPRIE